MTENYEDLLSNNVEEVKQKIRDIEDPDYDELLEIEREGKERKTVIDFLESRKDSEEGQEGDSSEEASISDQLMSAPPGALLGGGILAGLLIGAILGSAGGIGQVLPSQGGYTASPGEVTEDMETIFGSQNQTADVGSPERRHGMYFYNVSVRSETPNGTTTNYQQVYVTSDGELLFPVVESFLFQSPINVNEAVQQRANATS